MALGDNIRRLRVNRGMTQGDLSLKTGVKLGQISKIERNEADPKVSTIYKILSALDCSADSIFMDQEKTGVKGVLKEAFESMAKLPESEQTIIINIIDRFCVANGLTTMLEEHRLLIDISSRKKDPGVSKPLLKETIDEQPSS